MSDNEPREPVDWKERLLWLGIVVLLAWFLLACFFAGRAYGDGIRIGHGTFGVGPAPDTTRTTWTTSRADTSDTRATFLSESESFTAKDGDPSDVYVAFPASSAEQRVGLIGWVENLPDSITGTIEAATLTVYRLNSYDAAGADDSLEIAPVTVTWTEAQTTWINRRTGRPWTTPGGDVNTSYAVRVRAGDIPNLASGGAFAAVSFDITPLVEAWVAGTVAFNGVRLRWVTGTNPVVRFQDNAAPEPYRPQIAVQTYAVSIPIRIGMSRYPGVGSRTGRGVGGVQP